MKNKKRRLIFLSFLIAAICMAFGCAQNAETSENQPQMPNGSIILATTTSTQDSGLLDYLIPEFEKDAGIEVKVVAVGTGKALQMGIDGEADVLLVHSKAKEEDFVANGHGLKRFDVMYNDFVLAGPKEDPAGAGNKAGAVEAFKAIADKKAIFISRGDDSGTHTKELSIWEKAGISPASTGGDWYIEAGKGMADVLAMADDKLAYTLSDRATFLKMQKQLDLKIVLEGDKDMFNQYGVIAVNPAKNEKINAEGAQKFVEWILSEKTQKMISEFGKEEYGQSLFIPNAKKE